MAYTQEFIDRVNQLYPNNAEIRRLAEEGNYFLGRWLDDSSSDGFSPNEILNIPYEDLIKRAKERQAKRELYADFVSGKCYTADGLHNAMCPAMYMQNSCHPNRYEFEKQVCTGVGYVGCFPDCKKWGCREQCWAKYDELAEKIHCLAVICDEEASVHSIVEAREDIADANAMLAELEARKCL